MLLLNECKMLLDEENRIHTLFLTYLPVNSRKLVDDLCSFDVNEEIEHPIDIGYLVYRR